MTSYFAAQNAPRNDAVDRHLRNRAKKSGHVSEAALEKCIRD